MYLSPTYGSVVIFLKKEFFQLAYFQCPSRQCILPPPPPNDCSHPPPPPPPAAGACPAPAPGLRVQAHLPNGGVSLYHLTKRPSGAGQAHPDHPPRPHLQRWGAASRPAAAPRRSPPEVDSPTPRWYGENTGEGPSIREGDQPCTGC